MRERLYGSTPSKDSSSSFSHTRTNVRQLSDSLSLCVRLRIAISKNGWLYSLLSSKQACNAIECCCLLRQSGKSLMLDGSTSGRWKGGWADYFFYASQIHTVQYYSTNHLPVTDYWLLYATLFRRGTARDPSRRTNQKLKHASHFDVVACSCCQHLYHL